MPTEDTVFGTTAEFVNQTTLQPLTLAVLIVLGGAMLLLPRRFALLPMIVMVCFIPISQRIVVFGLDFHVTRIMVIFGWARLAIRNELRGLSWKAIDTVLVAYLIAGTTVMMLSYKSMPVFVFRLGQIFDGAGMYFLFRLLIRDWQDIEWVAIGFMTISIPVAVVFLIEQATGRNAFSVFGGVPEFTHIRQGRLRCHGAFNNPILAGCFWACAMPLISTLWWRTSMVRLLVPVGLASSLTIINATASSTPVLALACGVLGAFMFPLRAWMRWVRWAILLTLVGLHLVMTPPVWHLISRLNVVGGSTGWHRYNLINKAIEHFDEWWLLGTHSTAQWGAGHLGDVTNQYILVGVRGGLISLILFILILVLAYQLVGRLWRTVERDPAKVAMAWALGVSVFMHSMIFVAVTYFGQIILCWYLALAMIASLPPVALSDKRRPGFALRTSPRLSR